MEKTSFSFNVESEAYEKKLKGPSREKFDLLRANAQLALTNHEAEYQRHREQRIKLKEEELTKHYRLQLQLHRRRRNEPPPHMPTAQEISDQARTTVENGHRARTENLWEQHNEAINAYVQHALRLPKDFAQSRSGWLREQRNFDRDDKAGGRRR